MAIDLSDALYKKIQTDDAFMVSEIQSVSRGGTMNVHIRNPASSGKTVWIASIRASGGGPFEQRIYDGFSSGPSGGMPADIQSVLLDTEHVDNNGVVYANVNVSFEAESTHSVGVGGGGGSVFHPPMAIQESREMVIEVENTGPNEQRFGVHVLYFQAQV